MSMKNDVYLRVVQLLYLLGGANASVTLVQTSHQHSAQLLHTELVLFRSIGRKDPGEFKDFEGVKGT